MCRRNWTRGWTEVMPPICFPRNCNYNSNEIYIHRGCILYKVEIMFPQNLIYYQHIFSTLSGDASLRWHKTFSWSAGDNHTRSFSPRRRPQNGVLGSTSFRSRKDLRSGGAKSGLYGRWGPDSSSCLAEHFEFVALNLMSAHIAPNWFWHLLSQNSTDETPSVTQQTLAMALNAEVRTFSLFSLILCIAPV